MSKPITEEVVSKWYDLTKPTKSGLVEIITDVINGDYSIFEFEKDIKNWVEEKDYV